MLSQEMENNKETVDEIKDEAVKEEDVPDYYEIIKNPMCFDTMFMKLENNEYFTLDSFLTDIHLIQAKLKNSLPHFENLSEC